MKRSVLVLAAAALVVVAIVIVSLLGETPAGSGAPPPGAPPVAAVERQGAILVERARPGSPVDHDDEVRGTLRLEGQVIDAAEQPVGGAEVTIDTRPARTVITEADGSFAFDGLLGRPYELVATAGAAAAGPVVARLTERSEPVILRLAPGGELRVEVVSAGDRRAIANARVELEGVIDRAIATDAAGRARFTGVPFGYYRLAAASADHARAATLVRVGAGTATHRLELAAGVPVTGRVVDPEGRPVAGARVSYEGASDWQAGGGASAVTGGDGAFALGALPEGSFRFHARHARYAPGATAAIRIARGAHPEIVIRLRAGAALRGVVVDRAGAPVAWARVRAIEEVAGLQLQRVRQTTADAAGRFALAALPRARVRVVALHETAASSPTTLDLAGGDAEARLVLDVAGAIAGVVVRPDGEPVEGAQVSARPEHALQGDDARLRGRDVALTDAGGAFVLPGLAAGSYAVRVAPPGAADATAGELREETIVAAPSTGVRLMLPADGAITGRVVTRDGRAPAVFSISLGGWGGAVSVATRDGSFTLAHLPPRTYQLKIRGPGFAERAVPPITLAPGATADAGTILVDRGRSISGRVVDRDGRPVAGALVLAGPILWGTGSKAKAPVGFGGPPGADQIKDTTTGADGAFTLTGVGRGTRHVVADHEAHGRSSPIVLPAGTGSVADLRLVLVAPASLAGTVTRGGKPAARVVVLAQSATSEKTMFSVLAGPDGTYRFDRLAPDRYLVSAMQGADPMRGFGLHSRTVVVGAGEQATLDLAIDAGEHVLVVQPRADRPVRFALVETRSGRVTAKLYKDLERAGIDRDGHTAFAMTFGGKPARLEHLPAGEHTVCVVPYPDEIDPGTSKDYMVRQGGELPVYCAFVTLGDAPTRSIEIPVEIPAFVPPPEDDDGDAP